MKTKKVAFLSMCIALSMILSYFESLIPPLVAVPGIKVGLPNLVMVFMLYKIGPFETAVVSIIRVILVGMLFGSPLSMIYSLAGATLSLAIMAILKKLDSFSRVGVSVVGAIFHNLGQTLVAIFVLERVEIAYYMAALTVSGTVAGILVGLAAIYMLKLLEKVKF
jgi:heptaprenyl diphosphate synthase